MVIFHKKKWHAKNVLIVECSDIIKGHEYIFSRASQVFLLNLIMAWCTLETYVWGVSVSETEVALCVWPISTIFIVRLAKFENFIVHLSNFENFIVRLANFDNFIVCLANFDNFIVCLAKFDNFIVRSANFALRSWIEF